MIKLLVADDDSNLRKVLLNELSEAGYQTDEADSGRKAIARLEAETYDIVLLDLNMPGYGGMEVLKDIRSLEAPPEVIILTGHATVSTAVEAMKLGAYDYLAKPFKLQELSAVIEKAYEKKKLIDENLGLKAQIRRQSGQRPIITKNPAMLEVLDHVKKIATSDFPVLICGESGVGKELIAWAIHQTSDRGEGPFIPINCGAIPDSMLESELFGHEKGSFTGAYAKKLGLFEMANHGTIFLDEIGELSPSLQAKLLRVIETRSFFRVGGVKEVTVDVKFLCATNKDLKDETEKGRFRQDLYFRLSALTLPLPPLRDRKEDIPFIVEHIIQNNPACRNKSFSKASFRVLSEYAWPGNIRELQNVVHRVMLLSKNDVIEPDDLPSDLQRGSLSSGKRLEDIEKNHILKILKEVDGHKGRASEILAIDPKTLYRKLQSYGIND